VGRALRRGVGTRGACGARWETLVGARSDGGAGPLALTLRDSTRLFGQPLWVSISLADRDLTRFAIPDGGVFQDFDRLLRAR
jgi:hypothetical protein